MERTDARTWLGSPLIDAYTFVVTARAWITRKIFLAYSETQSHYNCKLSWLICATSPFSARLVLFWRTSQTVPGLQPMCWCMLCLLLFIQGKARTQSPTNKNYAPESPAFGVIEGFSQTEVQWKGLALGDPPSWSRSPLCQVSMLIRT